jgi:hypothetical protein
MRTKSLRGKKSLRVLARCPERELRLARLCLPVPGVRRRGCGGGRDNRRKAYERFAGVSVMTKAAIAGAVAFPSP